MTEWTYICRIDDIPRQGARRVARPRGLEVALFRTGADRIHALLDWSPYKGGPLSQGLVFGASVSCPLHGWTIGLADGQALAPDEGSTPCFRVRVDGGAVYLDAQQLAQHALQHARPPAGPALRAAPGA
ncbi:assimilatory nitrite reductase (NAD(P)H) small subunit [Oryzisolibacter propanilivorax]|uniref:Assimilatory nitrite reductase (NAD(P)H) small subunit n=1 Tax=Oryzisolibacter propanilivorax TaxID=1527607 RepID=A0A1G9P1I5_9BURK|nr:nitrite reductase small subunit NirD [Oryzisolibacter propanilivorax]SDL92471.1 assimilatory nitrite reductase (NAD(P)H) small subunit [Oryzisolibacter propanilivorax]